MPLINCPDCNKEISDLAPACLNCGRPNTNALNEDKYENEVNAACSSDGKETAQKHQEQARAKDGLNWHWPESTDAKSFNGNERVVSSSNDLKLMWTTIIVAVVLMLLIVVFTKFSEYIDKSEPPENAPVVKKESTKASSSSYNSDIRQATTSSGLSKADLAWHAQNTYGWDCSTVITKGELTSGGYFFIECTSGKKFRVYPRSGRHPKITNASGGYN